MARFGALTALLLAQAAAAGGPAAAFALVGPAAPVTAASLARYKAFVVDAFGAERSEVFVLLKALDMAPTSADAVRRAVVATLAPRAFSMNATDLAFERFRGDRAAIGDFLWPPAFRVYDTSGGRRQTEDRVAYWWGALLMVEEMIAAAEAARGRFDAVVVARSDLFFEAPIRHVSRADPRYWYSAPDPPDAFWILSRAVAEKALTTVAAAAACGAPGCDAALCAAADASAFRLFSWYIPCLWTARLWDTGLRLVADPDVRASWLHSSTGARRNVTRCATNVVCAIATDDAYDAAAHARPSDADFACGPWRSTRCPDGKTWGHGGPKARSCETYALCRRRDPACPDRRVSCPPR